MVISWIWVEKLEGGRRRDPPAPAPRAPPVTSCGAAPQTHARVARAVRAARADPRSRAARGAVVRGAAFGGGGASGVGSGFALGSVLLHPGPACFQSASDARVYKQ
jgi:hypothetical protein